MTNQYTGLTRNAWPGTWSPNGDHPIVISNEIKGGVHFVTGNPGDQLTDIYKQRLQEGMLVYVKNSYSNIEGNNFYVYKLIPNQVVNSSTGEYPNINDNWSKFVVSTLPQDIQLALNDLIDINTINVQEGSLLQYNARSSVWEATNNVDTQFGTLRLNGGAY